MNIKYISKQSFSKCKQGYRYIFRMKVNGVEKFIKSSTDLIYLIKFRDEYLKKLKPKYCKQCNCLISSDKQRKFCCSKCCAEYYAKKASKTHSKEQQLEEVNFIRKRAGLRPIDKLPMYYVKGD